MQFGHIPLALTIATYDWRPETALFCLAMHYLPNADSLLVKAGLDKPAIALCTRLEMYLRAGRKGDLDTSQEADPFWTENGGFHCTATHSVSFAVLVSLLVAPFSIQFAWMALIAILLHFAADIGSTVGLPLLWPFSRRKFTLSLFEDTGWWGKEMFWGYYKQPMAWVLEGTVLLVFAGRLISLYAPAT